MKNTTIIDTDRVRAYLLGDLRAEDMDEIEQAYFASESALDDVAAAEHEMIEEYLDGRPSWAGRFETHYLDTPAHRHRVEVIRELRSRARVKTRARIYFPLAVAAAVVIAAALGVVALRRGLTGAERGASVPGPAGVLPQAAASVALTLPSVLVRGESETPVVHLRGRTESVRLRLERPAATAEPPYRTVVKTVDGREVWSGEAAPTSGASVSDESGAQILATVTIPESALAPDDYIVVLSSVSDAATPGPELQRYFFRVARD